MSKVMLQVDHLVEVQKTVVQIDKAVTMVQDLADREDQTFPDAERLKELRRISRTIASCETALQRLFA